MSCRPAAPITGLQVSAYRVPTDAPEGDGTFEWEGTTLVLAEIVADGKTGLGYSYTDAAAGRVISGVLAPHIQAKDAFDIPGIHADMLGEVRNLGLAGICATAIAAVDVALWDLKAKLLDVSLLDLFGAVRAGVPVYGSGGFTSYSDAQLRAQFGGWAEQGFRMFKMKIGRASLADELTRVRTARAVIGEEAALFVDANGAYDRKKALRMAEEFTEFNVSWFEEPVSSDDLEGLHLLRDRCPAGMQITAGEYGYDAFYFQRMLRAQAVDVLQADATRCLGLTGFMQTDVLCSAFSLPLSFHCAPALHAAVACALPSVIHGEYFHDHARIEGMFFDGALEPVNGVLTPDRQRPGLGLEFRRADAERFRVA